MIKAFKLFLRLKAWQLFVLCFVLYLISFNNTLSQICYLVSTTIYLCWMFSIGYFMHSFVRVPSKPRIIYFEVSLLVMIAIVIISFFISLTRINEYFEWTLVVLALWASIYSTMFAARMLESVNRGDIANRSDSLRTFFYFCFFPIGFWLLQPSINRIMIEKESAKVDENQAV